jgi:hypothetical protein
MLRGAVSKFQRWQYRKGRPGWSARIANRLGALGFAAGIGPSGAAKLEVRGHKSNWVRNLRGGDGRAVLRRGRPEEVALVEDVSGDRAAILRRYLELAPGARPFFDIDRRAPLAEFERIVDQYPVFRVA